MRHIWLDDAICCNRSSHGVPAELIDLLEWTWAVIALS
jgi:hypothetical protein